MIDVETIRKRISYRLDIFGVQLQKVKIILLLKKDFFPIITPIIDVVIIAGIEFFCFLHGAILLLLKPQGKPQRSKRPLRFNCF